MSFQPETPQETPPEKRKNDLGDVFGTLPPSGSIPPQYTPPPPSAQPRRTPPILYILLGAALVILCGCGACLLVSGGTLVSIFGNPTVQAAMSTVEVGMGTASTLFNMPKTLPSGQRLLGNLASNETQQGNLDQLQQHVWQYQGQSGKTITITVTARDNSLIPMVGLYDPDNNLLKSSGTGLSSMEGSHQQTLTVQLPSDGTYSILVAGFGSSVGSYDIKLTVSG